MKAGTVRRGSSATEGDNVSVTSGFSSLTEDATLQEAYMGAVSDALCVCVMVLIDDSYVLYM